MGLDAEAALALSSHIWERDVLPALSAYIEIPCRSPAFDADWKDNGQLMRAVELLATWCRAQGIDGLSVNVIALEQRPPILLMELPGKGDRTVLLYGHYDKQPEGGVWRVGLGPWMAVREADLLYGRGAADNGYSVFAVITALRILRAQGKDHARCVVLIEGAEESGSADLPAYIQALRDRIGEPDLVVCLDAGAGSYDQLWITTSLRGVLAGVLTVRSLASGVHSGVASGSCPRHSASSEACSRALRTRPRGACFSTRFMPMCPPSAGLRSPTPQRSSSPRFYARCRGLVGQRL